MTGTLRERFEPKVDRTPGLGPNGDCHEWTACRGRDGYGQIKAGGKMLGAHRVAWELVNGPIPEGMCVLHRCDNPPCCRVEHLFLGSQALNMADMNAKGRQPKGSDNGRAKLTEADIPEIRGLLAEGVVQREIGRRYGVASSQISNIKAGHRWNHV
jgi:hypothetical protein